VSAFESPLDTGWRQPLERRHEKRGQNHERGRAGLGRPRNRFRSGGMLRHSNPACGCWCWHRLAWPTRRSITALCEYPDRHFRSRSLGEHGDCNPRPKALRTRLPVRPPGVPVVDHCARPCRCSATDSVEDVCLSCKARSRAPSAADAARRLCQPTPASFSTIATTAGCV